MKKGTNRAFRFAIVGCGVVSLQHIEALRRIDSATLAVVVDEDSHRAEKLGTQYGIEWSSDLDRVLARPDIDVVSVCVPSHLHAGIGIRAANSGKHVVMEKPIDIRLDAAQSLVDTCERNRVLLTVISQHRFHPGIRPAKDLIEAGKLGRLLLGDVQIKYYRSQEYYDSGAWRGKWATDGGGCLMNQGVHYVDIFRWLMGDAKRVTAKCATSAHTIEVEDIALAIVEFANGAHGIIEASTAVYPELSERIQISGTEGTILIEGGELAQVAIRGDDTLERRQLNLEDRPYPTGELHAMQLQDFLRAIETGGKPLVSGHDGLRVLEIILGVYESAKRDEPVALQSAGIGA